MKMLDRTIAGLLRFDEATLQRLELAAPWCVRVDGCAHPGMYVVHRGAARFRLFGRRLELAEGDSVLLPAGAGQHLVGDAFGTLPCEPHELAARAVRDAPDLHLRGPGPRARLSAVPFRSSPITWLPGALVVRRHERDPVAAALFLAYEQALEQGEAAVVARVAEAMWIRVVAERLPHVERFDADVLRVAAMVLDTPSTPYTLASLARAACLSRSRFSERFVTAFGQPPMRWVARVRMDHAERLLRGGATVAAVADRLGFHDESAFRKAYRRSRDRSPATAPEDRAARAHAGA